MVVSMTDSHHTFGYIAYYRLTPHRINFTLVSVQSYLINNFYSFTLRVASPVYVHARAKHVTYGGSSVLLEPGN